MSHAAEHYLPASVEQTRAVYRKVILRLLPYLVLAYAINTIDRLNVSFAKLRMAEDIGLTDAAYGIGAGIFFDELFGFRCGVGRQRDHPGYRLDNRTHRLCGEK